MSSENTAAAIIDRWMTPRPRERVSSTSAMVPATMSPSG